MDSETLTATAADTWTLGDLPVDRLGFGAMRLTGSAAVRLGTPGDRERSIAVPRRAVEPGVHHIDHIDTAAFCFSSLRPADELIDSALGGPYSNDLVIVTRAGPHRAYSGEWGTVARTDQLRRQVEQNPRQLGRASPPSNPGTSPRTSPPRLSG
ncbi:hypothetical protein SGFS_006190 [Streptomyces graminofaciens]|uniref:Oxidoreductase n=1 Tax=Streptomyces graminofaciens TaxID=68212 RepID=A0ABM7F0Y4_9ACTN|nr:hypothetical protein SGFS_006190 [Streptomyces graminofaciens]